MSCGKSSWRQWQCVSVATCARSSHTVGRRRPAAPGRAGRPRERRAGWRVGRRAPSHAPLAATRGREGLSATSETRAGHTDKQQKRGGKTSKKIIGKRRSQQGHFKNTNDASGELLGSSLQRALAADVGDDADLYESRMRGLKRVKKNRKKNMARLRRQVRCCYRFFLASSSFYDFVSLFCTNWCVDVIHE